MAAAHKNIRVVLKSQPGQPKMVSEREAESLARQGLVASAAVLSGEHSSSAPDAADKSIADDPGNDGSAGTGAGAKDEAPAKTTTKTSTPAKDSKGAGTEGTTK